ncbi:helix-turn-helix domain-containing protein [Paenibacillus sp. FSL R7-0297]|uniref:helix-turn-helix domain-containing protein n=1 Tax=unclassified Paenibacillus TaxID=185978 RepID=UPI0004F93040|nr:helix-turn-helix domain-containing protein [Paenibacillus sp. FSL R5-0912]AIQ43481.1 AraC family transcriptional regulator [Paenibacillus sp. FSL R5-0912]
MKKTPMILQLALILFCIMAIPTAILTWYSGSQIIQNSEVAIGESTLAGLNASRKLNENALANLAQDTSRLAATNIFDRIRSFETYDEINANYNNVSLALSVTKELLNLNRRVDGVYSSYFYLNDSDYVFSTDNSITTLERYESIDWINEALEGRRGISGVWVPRKLESGENVVSYVYPLNRLSSTTRGIIVVNLKESQIGKYLHATESGDSNYLLLDSDGKVISFNDQSLLLSDGLKLPFLQEILNQGASEGYTFRELDGKRMVYAWSRSALSGWWNVSWSSMDELMIRSRDMKGNIILLTGAIILLGTLLAIFLATWLSRPLRQLVRTIRSKSDLGVVNKNELAFLNMAFKRMQEEEESLFQLLQEREQDTRSLAVHRLLRGEIPPRITEAFPEVCYRVVVVSIDQYRRYVGNTNVETRSYHRYLLNAKYESFFPEGILARSVYHNDGCIVIVLNFAPDESGEKEELLRQALEQIRDQSLEMLEHSVTIGVSDLADAPERVALRLFEAMEVIKHRMINGAGSIMYWHDEEEGSRKYLDSESSERRILNFLDAGDLAGIFKELQSIRSQIASEENISYDNIMFIYYQLMGATIKHLRENHISTGRMVMGRGNVYSILAAMDTLDELEEYLHGFFTEIVQSLDRSTCETNHAERIIHYLKKNFREEIVFEDMAKEIGISYSYMRKIVYEQTGNSMIDFVNQLRIEKAKELLLDTECSIKQIAAEVGYYNVQSFNRFFRKYEGMPPSSYKSAKSKSS